MKNPATQLYPANTRSRLSESLFRRPSAEYRGTPFWAWNGALQWGRLRRQIGQFQQMGFGGFHMHARTGLATPYLGPEFMDAVRRCTQEAKQRKMLAWLYDEDRWPSGFGGGLVTQDPQHRLKYLLFTRTPYNGTVRSTPNISCAQAGRLETGVLLARYSIHLREGCLDRYRRLHEAETCPSDAEEWFAYLETTGNVPWFNHQGYVDTLSPAALARFIEVTYERFKEAIGAHIGKTVRTIFTDEPQHAFKEVFDHPHQGTDLTVPATTDFFETYAAAYGADLLDALPEVFWELPQGAASVARYRYHDHVTERFSQAFAAQLGQWCGKNRLLLTGHMMEEPTLFSQTRATGEAMRSLAHFQLPGIDMLCDLMEFTTAKQAQSVARQGGRPGVMSELYGVTGWYYDFAGHKAQGDWQAALGVTVRVPHLAWMSMAGEAKRDYPASIHYQSPWWQEYKLIEDHFARINVTLTRGIPVVRIGVIHPIESFWLSYGPLAQTKEMRESLDRQFAELPQWLLGGLLDFDYVSESLLLREPPAPPGSGPFAVGKMHYDVIVVAGSRTLRGTTLDRLEAFVDSGGSVVFVGKPPALVDALPSERALQLASRVRRCDWEPGALLRELEPWRVVDCKDPAGIRTDKVLYQLRRDGSEQHLFLCHHDRRDGADGLTVRVEGEWRVFRRDSVSGDVTEMSASYAEGRTEIPIDLPAHGHWLATLRPGRSSIPKSSVEKWTDVAELTDPVKVTLSEPNVLLLNQAEWRWKGGAWRKREELLKLHNLARLECGLPEREGHVAQPWTDHEPAATLGRIELRFKFRNDAKLTGAELALEEPEVWTCTLDGRKLSGQPTGWWVDEAIKRLRLPALAAGAHELILARDFTRKTELEWCYLLGDFGVTVAGRHLRLSAPVRSLAFGDWTQQGLPFYAGNVTYHCMAALPAAGRFGVDFSGFKAPLLTVAVDGGRSQPVAFAPFRLDLGKRRRGRLGLDITAFGNRHNAFGPLHNIDPDLLWIGPDAWRTHGRNWAYEYQLKPMGLLIAPRLQRVEFIASENAAGTPVVRRRSAAPNSRAKLPI